jgi:hypothetical protein
MFDKLAKAFDKNPFAFIFGAMLTGVLAALAYLALTAPAQARTYIRDARYAALTVPTAQVQSSPRPIRVQVKIPAQVQTTSPEPEQTVIATDQADADVCDEPKRCTLIAPKAMGVLMLRMEQLEKSQQKGAACL